MNWNPKYTEIIREINEKGIDGMRFAYDGKMYDYKDNIIRFLKEHGAMLTDTLTKNTDYLILMDEDSNTKKVQMAKEYGILWMNGPSFRFFTGLAFPNREVIHVPDWLTEVADGAFKGCDKLVEVFLPESIREIGFGAFKDCVSLETIHLPSKLERICVSAFEGCTSLREIDISKLHSEYIACGLFMGCTNLQSIQIPEGVERIDNEAFKGCVNLRSVILPKSLKDIGDGAFRGCIRLKEITLPEGVHRLLGHVFGGCRALRDVYVTDSLHYASIDDFRGCPKLMIHAPAGSYAEEYAKKNGIQVSCT